jgi:cytochrome d ubiquinol oxidase subunit II
MDDMATWLPVVWAALIGTAVCLYVILDGFDLGVGILFPLFPAEQDRDDMMNSVAPFWDGNETWLVLGGGGLFVAFPLAYSIIMPAVYLPVIVMLLALVFRGIAFEFRWVAKPHHRKWDYAFAGGSITAAFAQGLILGGFLEGIVTADNRFAGGTFDWLTPFAVFTGLSVLAGYALLGACWLNMRVDSAVTDRARTLAKTALVLVVGAMAVVSLWTPLAFELVAERWLVLPNMLYLAPIPLAAAGCAFLVWKSLGANHPVRSFLGSVGLFLTGFIGLVAGNAPYLVPPTITIWEAAAAPASQWLMLIGTLVLLPVILGYTVFIYWTFRGKVRPGEGYH